MACTMHKIRGPCDCVRYKFQTQFCLNRPGHCDRVIYNDVSTYTSIPFLAVMAHRTRLSFFRGFHMCSTRLMLLYPVGKQPYNSQHGSLTPPPLLPFIQGTCCNKLIATTAVTTASSPLKREVTEFIDLGLGMKRQNINGARQNSRQACRTRHFNQFCVGMLRV